MELQRLSGRKRTRKRETLVARLDGDLGAEYGSLLSQLGKIAREN